MWSPRPRASQGSGGGVPLGGLSSRAAAMALKMVKGSIDRMFDKNLQDLVRGIRNHKEDEVSRRGAGLPGSSRPWPPARLEGASSTPSPFSSRPLESRSSAQLRLASVYPPAAPVVLKQTLPQTAPVSPLASLGATPRASTLSTWSQRWPRGPSV